MKSHPFINIFLPLWLLFALWQACFTQLIPDEAYYWLYAQNLAWGYFDHPPMIALMIKAGTLLFANELGVRFFVVLFSTGTLWLMYKIVEPENEWLFIGIIISIVPLHLLVNFAVPDVPLLFFAALFFFALKQYLQTEGETSALLLLIAISGMLYSKYHAVLIIVFTLLAAPRIFKYRSFYFILVAAVVCYMPHIVWQFNHDLRSIKYHLAERNESSFSFQNSIDYLTGQLVILGPLASIPLLYCAFKYKTQNVWQRVLLFNLGGFLLFFLVMSYRGHIEPNWTVTCWIPLVTLSYKCLVENKGLWKWLKPIAAISIIGIVGTKVLLTFPVEDSSWPVYNQFHRWRKWATAIKQEAKGKPVIFLNSYQQASEYMFYAHNTGFSHNIPWGRGNQFDFWHYEDDMLGKKVMLVSPGWYIKADSNIVAGHDTIPYKWIDDYWGFGKVRIHILNKPTEMKVNERCQVKVVAKNRFPGVGPLKKLTGMEPNICYIFDKPETFTGAIDANETLTATNVSDTLTLTITAPPTPGNYALYFCFNKQDAMILATNSERIMVKVK